MKHIRLLLVISLLLVVPIISAQKRLTNREIYNFEVNDVIHSLLRSEFTYTTEFTKRKFLEKTYSIDQESVTYIVLDSVYRLVTMPDYVYVLTIRIDTITYVNLDSFPSPTLDTSYLDKCGVQMNFAEYKKKPVGKPYTELYNDRYVEGVGRYYSYERDNDVFRFEYTELRYYRKSGKECGQRVSNLDIAEGTYSNQINIYPNPVIDRIRFDNFHGQFEIYSVLGEMIVSGSFENEIILNNILDSGIYFLTVKTENASYFTKFIKL